MNYSYIMHMKTQKIYCISFLKNQTASQKDISVEHTKSCTLKQMNLKYILYHSFCISLCKQNHVLCLLGESASFSFLLCANFFFNALAMMDDGSVPSDSRGFCLIGVPPGDL